MSGRTRRAGSTPGGGASLWLARVPPLVLAGVGVVLVAALVGTMLRPGDGQDAPWWAFVIGLVPAAALTTTSAALVIDPRPPQLRRWAAGGGLAWLLLLWAAAWFRLTDTWFDTTNGPLIVVAAILGAALLGLALTTPDVVGEPLPGTVGRLTAAVAVAGALLGATVAATLAVRIVIGATSFVAGAPPPVGIPWAAVLSIVVLPLATFAIAAVGTRRAAGLTFIAQAAANRRNSLLLLITLVGVVAATAEIIAAAVTLRPVPALWAAGVAAAVGIGAALVADRVGAGVILETTGARPAHAKRDEVLLNVVHEIALSAGVPEPRTFVIEDASANAFATGRDPEHAAIVVTRGLLERMDREELQGVIGHEIGHVRNLDTRYALYVAVLVGLVALVTDGFLRLVVEGWRQGAFFWHSDDDDARSAIAALATGIAIGLFLLLVALVLRVVAPLVSLLVQAAVSREREYLADAASVELTRNPVGLQRALADFAADDTPPRAANRGTQHLWFHNPVTGDTAGRLGLFSTHPPIQARIDRLRVLQGLLPREATPPAEAPIEASAAGGPGSAADGPAEAPIEG